MDLDDTYTMQAVVAVFSAVTLSGIALFKARPSPVRRKGVGSEPTRLAASASASVSDEESAATSSGDGHEAPQRARLPLLRGVPRFPLDLEVEASGVRERQPEMLHDGAAAGREPLSTVIHVSGSPAHGGGPEGTGST